MNKAELDRIEKSARQLLLGNRRTIVKKGVTYGFTCPDSVMYQGQWLWDSCFHIIALRWFDPDFAAAELESLLSGQWGNGMVPNMVHLRPFYRRIEHFTHHDTSGITQPPIIADAAWALFERTQDRGFLERIFEPLCRFHDWLAHDRDPDGDGLISVYHPWETGIDNSCRWDSIFGVDPTRFKRWKFNIPKALLIMKFNFLSGYRSSRMRKVSLFDVEAVDMNCYYYRNMLVLARIADELGNADHARLLRGRAAHTKQSMLTKMWDRTTGAFYDLEGRDERMLRVLTPFSLLPLYAGLVDDGTAATLIAHLENPAAFWTDFPVPTVHLKHEGFDPLQYWRGTVWVNINWLLVQGLRRYGRRDLARELSLRTVRMVGKSGFREYYNPLTGAGHGAGRFGWSALVIDLIRTLDS